MAVPNYILDEMRRIGVQTAAPPDLATTTKRSSTPGDWSGDQLGVARRIYDIGRQRGESDDAIRAALSAGVVESEFNPRAVGDRSNPEGPAYGVLQQRKVGGYDINKAADPDVGVDYAANAFFDNARKVGSYKTPGLLAAQVQRPRHDLWGRYDQEMPRADVLFKQFSSGSVVPQHISDEVGRIVGQGVSPSTPVATSPAVSTPYVPDHIGDEVKRITSLSSPSAVDNDASPVSLVTAPRPPMIRSSSVVSVPAQTVPPKLSQTAPTLRLSPQPAQQPSARVTSQIDENADVPDRASLKPVDFQSADPMADYEPAARVALEQAAIANKVDLSKQPTFTHTGEAKEVRVPVDEQGGIDPQAMEDAVLSTLGPSAVEAGRQFRQETGRPLAHLHDDFSKAVADGHAVFDPKTQEWVLSVRPSEGLARMVNAYIKEGVPGAQRASDEIRGEADQYNKESQAERDRLAASRPAIADTIDRVASDTGIGLAQLAHNAGNLERGLYEAARYGTDSPQFEEATKREKEQQRILSESAAAVPQETTTGGQIVRTVGDLAAKFPLYAAAGEGAPLVAALERAHEGPEAAVRNAYTFMIPMGAGRLVGGVAGDLAGEAPSLARRAALNVGQRGAQGAIFAGQGAISPEGRTLGGALTNFGAGAILPTGHHGEEAATTDSAPVTAEEVAAAQRGPDLSSSEKLNPVETKTVVRHSSPEIDGDAVIGRTADGRLKAQGDDGVTHVIRDPRRQGNREAVLVKEAAPITEPGPEAVASATQPPQGDAARGTTEASDPAAPTPAHIKDEIARVVAQPKQEMPEPGAAERPPHVKDEVAQITSTANSVTEAERAERGLAPVEKQAYAAMGDSYLLGRKSVEEGRVDPRSLAQLVAKNPRPLTSDEVGALGYDRARLKSEHRDTLKAVSDAVDRGDKEAVADGRARLERVENDLDFNDQALQKGGREQSAAFNARRMIVRDDYDLDTLVRRAKAAKGDDLTPAERGQLEELSKRLEEAESKVAERDEQLSKTQAARATKKIVDDAAREARRQQRGTTKQELDGEFASLRAQFVQARAEIKSTVQPSGLAGIDPEGRLTGLVVKMARNRARAGVVTAEGLVDEIYNALKEHVEGLTRRDVRDAISGYGVTQEMSQDPAAKRLRDLKQQMRLVSAIEDAEAGQKPQKSGLRREPQSAEAQRLRSELYEKMKDSGLVESRRAVGPKLSEGVGRKEGPRVTEAPLQGPRDWLPAAKERLQKQVSQLEEKIARGEFTKPEPRPPVVYDREGNALKAKVESLRRQIDDEIRRRQTKGPLDYLVKWKRFGVLTYPTTLAKLGAAAAGRMAQTPVEEVVGGVLSKLPGVSRVAARAPREGGFNLRAEVRAVSQLWQSDSFRGVLEQLKGGRDMLDLLYGHKDGETDFMNLPGRAHGAIKEIPKRAEFFRGFEKRLAFAGRNGLDVSDPEVQMGAAMEAYVDAKRSIFMQPNLVSDAFNRALSYLDKQGVSGKAISALARFEFPITRVPVNYVAEQTSLIPPVGIAKGFARLAASGWRDARPEGRTAALKGMANALVFRNLESLTPDEADYVMRAWKKGAGTGLAMVTLGYLRPQNFGGYRQSGEKRDPNDAQAGEVVIDGHHIPRWLTHFPLLEAAQLGATLRRVRDEMAAKGKEQPAAEGLVAAGKGLVEEVPFFNQPKEVYHAVEGGAKGVEKFAAQQVRSLIPGAVQQYAQYADKDAQGQPVKRYPQGFVDEIKAGVPRLREQVPSSKLEPGFQRGVRPPDTVKIEMERLNVPAPDSGQKVAVGGREFNLTSEQQQKYREAIKAAAYPRLERLFASPSYQRMSDDEKRKSARGIIELAREPAKTTLEEDLLPGNRRVQTEARRAARKFDRTTDEQFLRQQRRREDRSRRRFFPPAGPSVSQ